MHQRVLAGVVSALVLGGGAFIGVGSANAEPTSADEAVFCEQNVCVFGLFCDTTTAQWGCDIQPYTGNGTCKTYDCNIE